MNMQIASAMLKSRLDDVYKRNNLVTPEDKGAYLLGAEIIVDALEEAGFYGDDAIKFIKFFADMQATTQIVIAEVKGLDDGGKKGN